MRAIYSVWKLLSVLILPSVGFAHEATTTGQFDVDPRSKSSIVIEVKADPDDDGDGVKNVKRGVEPQRTDLRGVNHLIVRFDSNPDPVVGPLLLAESRFGGLSAKTRVAMDSLGATISETWCDGRLSLVTLGPDVKVSVALERLRAMSQVRYAVPDNMVSLAEVVPNDSQFGAQWALRNTTGVDIDATLAWDQTTGSATTLVAVMDTGIDYTHPDLYLAVAINNVEIPASLRAQLVDTNGDGQIDFYDLNSLDAMGNVVLDSSSAKFNRTLVTDHNGNGYIDAGDLRFPPWSDGTDTDGNGLVDDLIGWDYVTNSNDPMDTFGHGTHVTGIIAARGNNGVGIAGVNWRVRILPVKFHNGNGASMSGAIQAIDYAVSRGARVINSSWGDFANDPALKDAIEWAGENGVVFVAAAGNQANNIDNPSVAFYPAAYDLPNLISVASVDPSGSLSDFSNFGPNSVDIAAPGATILSTGLSGNYVPWSGTSMATAHVTGVVSLLAALFPDKSPAWLVDRVLSTAKPLPGLVGKTRTGGMVDAFAAVNTANVAGPRIVSASPTGDVVTPTDRVVLTFDRAINANTFAIDDVSIVGPAGPVVPIGIHRLTDFIFEVVFPVQTAVGTYSVDVGPEIEDNLGRVMDQDRDGIIGEPLDDRFHVVFHQPPPPQIWHLDNGEAGVSASSGWSPYTGEGAQGDFLYKQVGSGSAMVTWTFSHLPPGQYRVSATWPAYSNRVLDAPYTILDGSTALATVPVDQRQAPAGFVEGGVAWQDLGGSYVLLGDTLVVQLRDGANPVGGYVVADTVRVERLGDAPAGPALQVFVAGTPVADGTGAVAFGSTVAGTPVTQTLTVRNGGTAALTLGALTVPSGFSVGSGFGATTLSPGQTTNLTVQLDAGVAGTFAGVLSFASNDSRVSLFDCSVSGTVTGQVWYLDDGEVGVSASSGWSPYTGEGAQGDFLYKQVGSGSAMVTWTFSHLPPGQYRVSATWPAHSNRVLDAPYTILDGSTALATVPVDQRQAPAGFVEGGAAWQDLGGSYVLLGDTLVVQLRDGANPVGGYVVADTVRVERLGDAPAGPALQVFVAGTPVADGTGAVAFGSTVAGTPVTQTLTVRNGGTAALTLGALTVPSGFSVGSGFGATTLSPGQTTNLTVQLDAGVAGTFAGVLSFASNDSRVSLFDCSVSGTVTGQVWYLDDGEVGVSASSGWSPYTGEGAQGDFLYKQVGSGSAMVTWTFSHLPPGQYRVSATWPAYSNRVLDAPYTILDGSTALATVPVDQRQAPAGFVEGGAAWQDLGGSYVLLGDTLVVQLRDGANPVGGYVVADTVRVERLGDAP